MFIDFLRARFGVKGSARSKANAVMGFDTIEDCGLAVESAGIAAFITVDVLKVLGDRERMLMERVVIRGEGLKEVSEDTGLSMARVSQIVKASLLTLKESGEFGE